MATCDSIYQLVTKTKEPSSHFTMKITDKENPVKNTAQDFQFIWLKTVPLCQQQQKCLLFLIFQGTLLPLWQGTDFEMPNSQILE